MFLIVFVMTLAGVAMGLTLEESLVAATLNAAASLDRSDRVGSLEIGKQFDAVVVDGALSDVVRVGASVIKTVIKRGWSSLSIKPLQIAD